MVDVLVEPNTPNPVLCVEAALPKPKLPSPPRPVLADVAGVPKLRPAKKTLVTKLLRVTIF